MNSNFKIIEILIFISLVLCISVGVSIAEDSVVQSSGNDVSSMDIINDTQLREEILSNLESNGVNTSVLRAAITVGATGKVKNILEYYKDKLQANPNYVKPEQSGNESGNENVESKTNPVESTPVPTGTKSPLSPFTALAGIGAAGCVAFLRKR